MKARRRPDAHTGREREHRVATRRVKEQQAAPEHHGDTAQCQMQPATLWRPPQAQRDAEEEDGQCDHAGVII
jgi:hypothetical protein